MRTQDGTQNRDLVAKVVKGALAGAAGVWALDQVTWFLWDREDRHALEQEREARPGGLDPAHVIANRVADAVGAELTPKQPHPAGIAVHYALGVLPGALYAALQKRTDGPRPGRGLLLGLGLFLLQDEFANWLLGTSGAPTKYPWQAHVRGLVGHMTYGAVTDATLAILDQVA